MSWDGTIYGKYRIEHTDGTPLKGKKYFVMRLDSDNPVEAARVAAAMRAYKSEIRNCDIGTEEEQRERFIQFCRRNSFRGVCSRSCKFANVVNQQSGCQRIGQSRCFHFWAKMPYEEGGAE